MDVIKEGFAIGKHIPEDIIPLQENADGSVLIYDPAVNMVMRTLNDEEREKVQTPVEEATVVNKKLTYGDIHKKLYFLGDKDGVQNGIFEINGEQYRVRVETLIRRTKPDGTPTIFFEKKDKETHYGTMYKLPGGSVEPNKTLASQAEAECNEEVLAKVKDVHYSGKYYIVKYDPKDIPAWHKEKLWPAGIKYVGAITFVFVAEYDGPYTRKVPKVDQDDLAKKGDWYPAWEFEEIKAEVHDGVNTVTESYLMESYKGISDEDFKKYKDSTNGYAVLKLAIHGDEETEKAIKVHRDKETKKITFTFNSEDKTLVKRWINWANGYSNALKFRLKNDEVVFTDKKGNPVKESLDDTEDFEIPETPEPVTEATKVKEFKDFDDFCKIYETPEEVLDFLHKRGAHWPTKEEAKKIGRHNNKAFTWPEEMITKDKPVALCFDYAVFFHYYFEKRKVLNHVALLGWQGIDGVPNFGHAICIFKRKDGWYIVDYRQTGEGLRGDWNEIYGPVRNKDDLVMFYLLNGQIAFEKKFPKAKFGRYYYIQTEEDMKRFYDKHYGSDIPQIEIMNDEYYYFTKNFLGDVFKAQGKPSWLALPFKPIWMAYDVKHFLEDAFEHANVGIIEEFRDIINLSIVTEAAGEVSGEPEPEDSKPEVKEMAIGMGSGGIINDILQRLGDRVDMKQFAEFKTGKKFMYTRCRVMQKFVPLIVFLGYCEGLTTVMRKAEVQFSFSDTRPRLAGMELNTTGVIPFADGYLIYRKYPLHISLLMNGLLAMNTKCLEYADMDSKDTYADFFETAYGARMLANALGNFYDLMIDSVTKEVLDDMNYPTEFVELMLAGNKLLADNNYVHELDMKNWRIRNNEQVYAHAYKKIADAYSRYKATAGNKNPVKISIPRDAVLKEIMKSQIVEDVPELSPIVEVKKKRIVTDKGKHLPFMRVIA